MDRVDTLVQTVEVAGSTPRRAAPRFVAGEGVWLVDDSGRRYLDCASGTFNVSLGHGHPEVLAAMQAQADLLIHGSAAYHSPIADALAERLGGLAPGSLSDVRLKSSGGSTANEGAIKMAQWATGRQDVVSLFHSHHGQTVLAAQVSGSTRRRAGFPALGARVLHVPAPYCFRCFYNERRETCGLLCAERINDFIDYASSGSVACIIVEPVLGSGGNIVAPDGYLDAVRDLCDERDIVLIFDEVQTGIGRTGRMFAAEHFGVEPDILTLGKGLGGIGAQVAAIVARPRLAAMPADLHAFTNGGNLMAAAAALKTLEIVERPGFLEHVRAVGARILERMSELQRRVSCIGDVRGLGLMLGVEITDRAGRPDAALTSKIARRGPDYALVLRTSSDGRGNVVKIRPPLVIADDEAEVLCDRFEQLVTAVAG